MQSNLVPDHVVSHAIATANEKELQIAMVLSECSASWSAKTERTSLQINVQH